MRLVEFIDRYRESITRAVLHTYPPIYDAEARRACGLDMWRLLRRPLGAQADAIRAVALSLHRGESTVVVGEMGVGKTMLAASAAYLAGCRRVLIVCPPHLVRKWRREILQTVPGAAVAIVRTIRDLESGRLLGGRSQFVVLSREQAKLGYRWIPTAVSRPVLAEAGDVCRDDRGAPLRQLCCPDCFGPIVDEEGIPLGWSDLRSKRLRCRTCEGPLWQADRTGPRRYPLADYIRRRMPGHFDLLIADEVHEFKAKGSAQGLAAAGLAEACGKTLALTGTVFGGYSSTLFYLLWRFSPAVRAEFGYRDEARWVSRYGIVERITKQDPDAYSDDGRYSKRRSYLTRTVEKPGVLPAILFHLIGNTVFLRLADVARNLPPYSERVALFPLDRGEVPGAPSQSNCYSQLAQDLWQAVASALQEGSKRLLATYLQALLSYPDACTRGETVLDPVTREVLGHAPALPADRLYPKELALVELVRRERARGRRVLVYITHTESRDISPRLSAILEREGFCVAVLKAGTVPADRREDWVAARAREGVEVLICHPRLVQTGLDLVDWPSVVWYEVEYSVYVMRQASRRSWRIGQREPVEVTFLVYEGTLQAEALALVAAKMRSALMIEGELPEDGLAALEGDGQDVFLALARRLTNQTPTDARSLDALFAQSRLVEAEAEGFLVDGTWQPEPERVDHVLPADEPLLVGTDLWTQVLSGKPQTQPRPVQEPAGIGQARVVSFEELEQLVRRPKPKRKPVPEGQLVLFTR